MYRALSQAGHDVVEARSGHAAAALIGVTSPFDPLVTDVRIPSLLDDVALASVWRRQMQGRPVLFVSGYSGSLLDENAFSPHEAVLYKPFQRAILQHAVRLLLARHVSAAMPASASVGGGGATPPRSGCAL